MAEKYHAEIVYSDLARLVRQLNEIEDNLSKEMRGSLKDIIKPAKDGVQSVLREGPNPPVSGMRKRLSPVGLTWNNKRSSTNVRSEVVAGKKVISELRNQNIARLVIYSPAAIIADMAGKTMKTAYTGKTDWYVYPNSKTYSENYKPGYRRHTVSSQGKHLVSMLDARWGSGASRKVWPEAERRLPAVANEVMGEIENFVSLTNQELGN